MPVKEYDREYEQLLERALSLVEFEDTDVTEEQVRGWDKSDLKEWVDAWDEDD